MSLNEIEEKIQQNNLELTQYKFVINTSYGHRPTPIGHGTLTDKILKLRFENFHLKERRDRLRKIKNILK